MEPTADKGLTPKPRELIITKKVANVFTTHKKVTVKGQRQT
jgi:hypothetical protein